MFWKRDESDRAPELREYVRERLLLALEFATLGAYEVLDEPAEATAGRPDSMPAGTASSVPTVTDPGSCDRPMVRQHVSGRGIACREAASDRCPLPGGRASDHPRVRSPHEAPRRPGQPQRPEQPCIWVAWRASAEL
jgi:hypothetical protein